MSFLLTTFRTRFRYRLRDSESPYRYSNTIVDAWGNAALEDINVQVPNILANAVIDGDGSAYSFDLSLKARFMLLHRLSLVGSTGHPIIEHPSGIEYIRGCEEGSGITSSDPSYYVVVNHNTLYIDAIISAASDLKLDYYQYPRTWVETVTDAATQSLTPDGMLAIGYDELILSMAAIKAGRDIGSEFGDALVEKHYASVYGDRKHSIFGLLRQFEDFVSKQSHNGNREGIRYSDYGQDPQTYGLLGR